MHAPTTSGNGLLAAYCRAHGLDLAAECAGIRARRRDDALRGRAAGTGLRRRAPLERDLRRARAEIRRLRADYVALARDLPDTVAYLVQKERKNGQK